jgi:hypothetical protein
MSLDRRIDKIDHELMNVIANRAFQGSDAKTGLTLRDSCPGRYRFALWAA